MRRKPWMKFYTSDWRADPALRRCSPAARGLWIDMITLMHEANDHGNLLISGVRVTPQDLAGIAGISVEMAEELTRELVEKKVCGIRRNGVLYSRRIERDEINASKKRANGAKGGNPALTASRGNVNTIPHLDNHTDNHTDNQGVKPQRPETRDQRRRSLSSASDPTTAREPAADGSTDDDDFLLIVLGAAGIDVTKDVAGKWLGSTQRWNVEQWIGLGLSEAEIPVVIADVMRRHRNGPISSLAYFNQAMQEAAGRKLANPLKPLTPSAPRQPASVFGEGPERE